MFQWTERKSPNSLWTLTLKLALREKGKTLSETTRLPGTDDCAAGCRATVRRRHPNGRRLAGAHLHFAAPYEIRRRQPCSTEERVGPGPLHDPPASTATASAWRRGSSSPAQSPLSHWTGNGGEVGSEWSFARQTRAMRQESCWPAGAYWTESEGGLQPRFA
jgi:hypothetical protein